MAKTGKKPKKRKPSSNGRHGRNNKGQFAKGHKLSVGNKGHVNEKARELKKALIEAVGEKDIKAISKKLIEKAKAGDIPATRELFDRLWGRAIQEVDLGDTAAKTIFDILAVCGLNGGNGD